MKINRILASLLLILALSFTSVFATDPSEGATENGTQTQTQTEVQQATQPTQTAAAPAVVTQIVKKGKYYYYKDPKTGKIRKKAGFVTDNGIRYYIKKGGKIVTGKSFKVKKKTYRAAKDGKILTGVYKWGKYYYYSNDKGEWLKGKKLKNWNGNLYYIQKNGKVLTKNTFSYEDQPYLANSKGAAKKLAIPDAGDNAVVAVARKQLGIKTGKKYWTSYFGSKFRNRDATPWCATFVRWVYKEAGSLGKISGIGNKAYVPSYVSWANRRGKWVKKSNAKAGDIIVFGKGGSHVGIVEGISDGCVITIEGNTLALLFKGGRTPGQVQRKAYKLSDKYIKGIIRP